MRPPLFSYSSPLSYPPRHPAPKMLEIREREKDGKVAHQHDPLLKHSMARNLQGPGQSSRTAPSTAFQPPAVPQGMKCCKGQTMGVCIKDRKILATQQLVLLLDKILHG